VEVVRPASADACGIAPGALIGGCDPPQPTSNAAARLMVSVD
jgi:hypothetical protein